MASDNDSTLGSGTSGTSRNTLENTVSENVAKENDSNSSKVYAPSPKHDKGGWGSSNPIKINAEGQKLLDTGYLDGKQIYNVTEEGKIVKFQPANTPNNEYHSYEVNGPRDIPNSILQQMKKDGLISQSDFNKLRKGKKKK